LGGADIEQRLELVQDRSGFFGSQGLGLLGIEFLLFGLVLHAIEFADQIEDGMG